MCCSVSFNVPWWEVWGGEGGEERLGEEGIERMGVGRSDRSCTCDLIPFSSIDSIWPTI
jgi:hypothetical protein